MVDLHGDVLARLERRQRAAVGRLEIERRDDLAFGSDAIDHEPSIPVPAAVGRRLLGVDLRLAGDEDIGQEPVGLGPGGGHLLGDGFAQDVLHRDQKVLADDRIMLRTDAQRAVLLRDQLDRRPEGAQVVDVRGIGADRPGERPLLTARMLVCLVEENPDLRVALEHQGVKSRGDRLGVRGHGRGRRLDDLDGVVAEHHELRQISQVGSCDGFANSAVGSRFLSSIPKGVE